MVRMLPLAVVVTAVFAATPAAAQQAINTSAATQPSTGRLVFRQLVRYAEGGTGERIDGRDLRTYSSVTTLDYGLRHDVALSFEAENAYRRYVDGGTGSRETDFGADALTALVKYRIYQNDFGPIDTARLSVFGGLEYRSGNDISDDGTSFNPVIGAVYTHIEGRHGYNAAVQWKAKTGRGADGYDQGRYDLAYLYRLHPHEYQDDTYASLYGIVELNGRYETSGVNELFLSPGLLYEARTWAVEATVQIPVWQELKGDANRHVVVGVGLRLLF